jgi:hypothetical protein
MKTNHPATQTTAPLVARPVSPAPGKAAKRRAPCPRPGSREANKLAVAILDVLAGARLPADAARAVGISLPRYYQLEQRVLDAIVTACEPRVKGPGIHPARQLAQLEVRLELAQILPGGQPAPPGSSKKR